MTLIALSGQPNTGKSTVFNQLTGVRQKIANFPGVTVEKKEGVYFVDGQSCTVVDLPGLYSLDPRSIDETIAADFVLGKTPNQPTPDCVAIVANAYTLEKGLYFISQFQGKNIPVVLVVNMLDTVQRSGIKIDLEALSEILDVPVIGTIASKGIGIDQLKKSLLSEARPVNIKAAAGQNRNISAFPTTVHERHKWANDVLKKVTHALSQKKIKTPQMWTDVLDRFALNPVMGPLIFLVIMSALFQSIFTWAVPLMDVIDTFVGWVGSGVVTVLPSGLLQSFIVDGLIAGMGNVIIFVPQIMILFGFLTILEDSGYLSRASFLLDRILVKTGLSGKSFIPLLSSFACAIPGIMAARHIDDRKERLMTIMVAPLMTCSARLPVYALLIAAFIPTITIAGIFNLQGMVFLGLYLMGIVGAAFSAWVMKKVWLKKHNSFYVSELPLYQMPNWKNVFNVMIQRGKVFTLKAGKIILICTMALWVLATFPRNQEMQDNLALQGLSGAEIQAETLKHSTIGKLGKAIEPVIAPLGFDWKMGIGLISSFAAREVVVSTMGTLYSMADADETSVSLKDAMRKDTYPDGRPVFNVAVALSLLMFYVFAMQCMSTLAITRRETNSWKIPTLMFTYMLVLAYGASWVTYNLTSYFL
jgi:ferrous iron transport protein B